MINAPEINRENRSSSLKYREQSTGKAMDTPVITSNLPKIFMIEA
jgi:hypothetical protein